MKKTDKILLSILLVSIAFMSAFGIMLEIGILPIEPVSSIFGGGLLSIILTGVVFIALLFLSLRELIAVLFPLTFSRDELNKTKILSSELGSAYITLDAINAIAKKKCLSHKSVCECRTTVAVVDTGVAILLKIVPAPEVVLPMCMQELQQTVKATVESQTGVMVVEVSVLILTQSNTGKRA